jgi:lipoprotein NlpI
MDLLQAAEPRIFSDGIGEEHTGLTADML